MSANSLFGIPLFPGYSPSVLLEQNNTYGFFSVNEGTFNRSYRDHYTYPELVRGLVVTILAIHNLVLNILSYTHFYVVSGIYRILTGVSLCVFTLTAGERHAQEGFPIQHWYDEALVTGAAQILRGMIDICVPFGHLVNTVLDGVNTGIAFARFWNNPFVSKQCYHDGMSHGPYSDPISSQFLMFVNAIAISILFLGGIRLMSPSAILLPYRPQVAVFLLD